MCHSSDPEGPLRRIRFKLTETGVHINPFIQHCFPYLQSRVCVDDKRQETRELQREEGATVTTQKLLYFTISGDKKLSPRFTTKAHIRERKKADIYAHIQTQPTDMEE